MKIWGRTIDRNKKVFFNNWRKERITWKRNVQHPVSFISKNIPLSFSFHVRSKKFLTLKFWISQTFWVWKAAAADRRTDSNLKLSRNCGFFSFCASSNKSFNLSFYWSPGRRDISILKMWLSWIKTTHFDVKKANGCTFHWKRSGCSKNIFLMIVDAVHNREWCTCTWNELQNCTNRSSNDKNMWLKCWNNQMVVMQSNASC